jgi:V8-like Glu-specific endopeptidase
MRNVVRFGIGLVTAAVLVGVATTPAQADPPPPPGTPTATTSTGTPTVGALFPTGVSGKHTCTASVIASPTHNLILTAGHCVSGTAAGWSFAPGYDDGATPYGVWTVQHAYVAPQWQSTHDTQDDYAILQVARQTRHGRSVGIQDVTGANLLATAPQTGQKITDVAYNDNANAPVTCTVPTYRTDGYPSFNCDDYLGGSSGSPWLAPVPGTHLTAVHGVIGGLHQGGCFSYTSYSSGFTPAIYSVYARAVLGFRPDDVTPAGSDGC